MKNKSLLLLKALLLSTSQRNIYKHTTDPKKRKKIVSGIIGAVIIYAMLMVYSVSICIGYGSYGIIDAAPVMCSLVISLLALIFTLLRTNGYLFNFKEYDMLMSLPFGSGTVAACKFLYMYIKTLPWYLSISIAMMAGYGYYAKPNVLAYILWIILTFILPLIPMLIASFIGFLIAKVSAGFRKNNIIQTVLTLAFVMLCFSSRFIIEDMFRNEKTESTLRSISAYSDTAAKYYPPAKWFSQAVTELSFVSFLLLVIISLVLFAVLFFFVGRSYRNINSALKSHAAAKKYKMAKQKKRSIVNAVAFKEFKRMTGSTNYLVNCALGELLAVIVGVIMLIFGFENIISKVTQGAPLTSSMLAPAIPFIAYFFIGMVATTVCSPSLEGKNYWIIQSLPIEKTTIYNGKMLFNMYLTVPFMAISTVCMCISAKVPTVNILLDLILGFALCAFSTAWGCVCGIKHMRLDWENEIEVIKQGTGVMIYLLPNMFVAMGVCALSVYLGTKINHSVLALRVIAIVSLMAALSYRYALKLAKRS
jgi:ABC-2 type transport system permease protein